MRHILRSLLLIGCSCLCPAQTPAIASEGVLNSASYLPACTPAGAIAQGSLFVIFGQNLGPASLVQASGFPLQTSLAQTSIRVTVGAVTVDAYPMYTSAGQVAAVLPSRTPVGLGSVVVSYQGRVSAPAPMRVARSAFGIYTVSQTGTGGAVGQIADGATTPVSTVDQPIRAGQTMILWGTGLGPVTKDEAAGPLPFEPKDISVRVWIGDKTATVTYQGRSGCCPGIDQINFEVPAGIDGCSVPVSVEIDGVYSNYATLAIALPGQTKCSGQTAPPQAKPNTALGLIGLYDYDFGVFSFQAAEAAFERVPDGGVDLIKLLTNPFGDTPLIAAGSCTITPPASPTNPVIAERQPSIGLDAGAEVRVTGPSGLMILENNGIGSYSSDLNLTNFFSSGRYRITNGSGGTQVGPFSVDLDIELPRLTTTFGIVQRSQDLNVRWSAPSNASGFVILQGSSRGSCGEREVSFLCVARTNAGQLTIPNRILRQLPASVAGPNQSTGGTIYFSPFPGDSYKNFSATGLDLGVAFIFSAQGRAVTFQ